MEVWLAMLVTAVTSIGASSGFWTYIQRKDTRRNAMNDLVLGLGHDRIVFLGMGYVDRGWITKDEYEDFMKHLYLPYSQFGGNGLAEKVVSEVKGLPIRGTHTTIAKFIREKHADQENR